MKLSARAEEDLMEIWSYGARTWGLEQADRYQATIESSFLRLTEFPKIGERVSERRPEYRRWKAGSHRIIYRIMENDLLVLRVIHGRTDLNAALPGVG